MTATTKDIVYIDIDDEITAIIDKVGASKHKIVALVLPKRSTVLQSIVNMKLLKRSADEQKKNVVLITTEAGLLPLAGAVGLHVAPTPQSKPAIPRRPDAAKDDTESVEESDLEAVDDFDPRNHADMAVGALAGAAAAADEETIQLDNEPEAPAAAVAKGASRTAKPPKGKNKKLKVPDFNKFRLRLILGGLALVLLIVLWVVAATVLPKATIAIQSETDDINSRLDVTFDTEADGPDLDETGAATVPAKVEQTQKTTTQTAQASGQQNNGDKASGQATLSYSDFTICAPGKQPVTVPAGTGLSTNSLTYVTQKEVKFGRQGGNCTLESNTNIVATKPGSNYNVSNATMTVTGHSSDVTATGSTDGGTDDITKIVEQSDIDSAKQKLSAQTDDSAKSDLAGKLQEAGLFVIKDSFNGGTPEVTASAKAGDEVDSVTVTQKTTYSMVGAKKADLDSIIKQSLDGKIDKSKQSVLSTGLDSATFKLQNQQDNSKQTLMAMDVTSRVGPDLNDEEIKSQVAGKKAGEAEALIKKYPGVNDVTVKYSPFWVSAIPKNHSKITITYEK